MIGGLKQTTSRLAIAAAAGLFTGGIALTPVQAASLGGDCCADLEERVAELEATTVRKGNRKVSVKLSGQVNRAILFWDDGEDDDVYFIDNDNSSTRFRITGSATISPGRTAGFKIEADWFIRNGSNSLSNCDLDSRDQGGAGCMALPEVSANNNDMRQQNLWIKFNDLGKVTLGQQSMAADGTAEVDLSGTGVVIDAGSQDIGADFVWRTSGGSFTTNKLDETYTQLDPAGRRVGIRYDTPSIGGFTFSTSYGADDFIDGAVRFKKEWNSVRCAAAAGITHNTDEKGREFNDDGVRRSDDLWEYAASGSCLHTPSGLNLSVAWSETDEGIDDVDKDWWFVKGGITRRWNAHGKTSISIQYGVASNFQSSVSGTTGVVTNLNDEVEMYGVGFVQKIDSAALELYAGWMVYERDDNTATNYEDLSFGVLGARIKF